MERKIRHERLPCIVSSHLDNKVLVLETLREKGRERKRKGERERERGRERQREKDD